MEQSQLKFFAIFLSYEGPRWETNPVHALPKNGTEVRLAISDQVSARRAMIEQEAMEPGEKRIIVASRLLHSCPEHSGAGCALSGCCCWFADGGVVTGAGLFT